MMQSTQKNKMKLYFIVCLSLILVNDIPGQGNGFDENGIGRETVIDEQLKTIQFYREGWINSYPILLMNESVPLILEFDDITSDVNTYFYMVYHCDADWRTSELTEQEYMDGYFENRIEEMESSFNTYTSYNHFRLEIPNKDIRLTRSGNYLLVVYRDNNPDDIVFTRRFMISEAKVSIEARANRPVLSVYRESGHEIDVKIHHPGYRIDDPYRETILSIYQNGIWDYEISGLQPLFVNPDELVYDYQKENVFLAGNEFRMFNTRSTQVREYHVMDIEFIDYFHFQLKHDEVNPAHLYFDRDDLNGKFFIEAANVSDPSTEADYGFVHFTLDMPFPLADGDVYVAGATSNWQFTDMNRMSYDNEKRAYTATMFLKQGIHNYRYVYLPDNSQLVDISEIEGSHYQTKNEYLLLFYHRGQSDRFDRLVGHQVIHSN